MKKNDNLLDINIINRAKKLNSTLIADAMDANGTMDYKVKPVTLGMKVVGTALTIDLRAGDNLFLHQGIYSGGEGHVLIADGKGFTGTAYLGELMASAAQAMGIEGIVIDGLVRDKEMLGEIGLPIFAKGFVSSGPFKNGPGAINVPISCAGVAVNPGDLIIGDEDGVVVVPKENADNILKKAENKLGYEEERIRTIEAYKLEREKGEKPKVSIAPNWLEEKINEYK